MPDKQLTIATYAAGASLAAITLVYVFAPTFFIDEQSASASASSRKKGVVGLSNPANDCFINSVLQSLASLGDLRLYLIREIHRRTLDNIDVYTESSESKSSPSWKTEGLQQGLVTHGLKEILDALNERPLYKKTISASGFVLVLEKAFRQRISRQQQDAQEFLQVVAERLNDEYHAGHLARQRARARITNGHSEGTSTEKIKSSSSLKEPPKSAASDLPTTEHREDSTEVPEIPIVEKVHADAYIEEDGFPLEGTTESQIECLTCGFKPKPSETTFCTLTVNVPQVQSTSLNACFDGIFKTEQIDDFKCEKCRLIHAVAYYQDLLLKSNSDEKSKLSTLETIIERLQKAIEEDPEHPPKDIDLPPSKYAPKRKIARHVRITKFPKVLAIHLSRSIFDFGQSSMKNSAKVSFPERLPLGGLVNRRNYKLLAVTTHKGSHQSGHYETFRRQSTFSAFSTPNHVNPNGAYGMRKSGSGEGSRSEIQESTEVLTGNGNLTPEDDIEEEEQISHSHSPLPTQTKYQSPTEMSLVSDTSLDSRTSPSHAAVQRASTDTDSHRSSSPNLNLRKRLSKISTSSSSTKHPNRHSSEEVGTTTTTAITTPSSITEPSKDKNDIDNKAETNSISSSIRRRLSKVSSLSTSLSNRNSKEKFSVVKRDGLGDHEKGGLVDGHIEDVGRSERLQKGPGVVNGNGIVNGNGNGNGNIAKGKGKMKKRKIDERWWRISDEKVKECRTTEVLGMQKEVYLLFYELER